MAMLRLSGFDLGDVGADHRIASYEIGELFLAPAVSVGGPHRHHHVADLGVAVPNTNLNFWCHIDAKLGQHLAWFDDYASAIGCRLVPVGRQAHRWPRIARAQCAHDNVMYLRRILKHHHVLALEAGEPEFSDRLAAIVEEALFVGGIRPSVCHHFGAVAWADALLEEVNDLVDRAWVH